MTETEATKFPKGPDGEGGDPSLPPLEGIDLGSLELLARGGQSRVYAFGDGEVLREPMREADYRRIEYEYGVYRAVQGKLPVPRVRGLAWVNGKPCIVMQKIPGPDWYGALRRDILSLLSLPRRLADLHARVLRTEVPEPLENHRGKATFCVNASAVIGDEVKRKVLALMDARADGDALCHGDFHPGNVIAGPGGESIIDWSSASRGSPLFDVAHTYLLLVNTPRLEGVGDAEFRFQRRITRFIGVRYLRRIVRTMGLDPYALWDCFLVKAAERSFYGLENEKPVLARFLAESVDAPARDLRKLTRLY